MRKSVVTFVSAVAAVAAVGAAAPADAAAHGRVKLSRHGVVLASSLPHCAVEDASSGPTPCSWNFDTSDGNGRGLAYYVNKPEGPSHYVWAHRPTWRFRHGFRWVSAELGDALAESGLPDATTRRWERCLVRYGDTTRIVCADGFKTTS